VALVKWLRGRENGCVPEDLSREELIALVKALAATNTALQTMVEALTATVN